MLLVKPPLLVNSEVFRMYHGQDATKQAEFDLSNLSSDSEITLSIRNASGKIVVGTYDLSYQAFRFEE